MTPDQATETRLASLQQLPRLLEANAEFAALLADLHKGRAGAIDGAWNSSASLAAATLGLNAPQTLFIVLAHPRDVDLWIEDLASFTGERGLVFPAWDTLPTADTVIDEVAGQRLRILKLLESPHPPHHAAEGRGANGALRFLVTTMQALMQPVPDRRQLAAQRRVLNVGDVVDLDALLEWLVEHGFERMDAVELAGECSRRGGIVDIFSLDAEAPFRLEFFGDELESIRQFSVETQRSLAELKSIEITGRTVGQAFQPAAADKNVCPTMSGHLCDYLPQGSWTALVETEELHEQGRHYLERLADSRGLFSVQGVFAKLTRFASVRISTLPTGGIETTCHLRVESVERFSGDVTRLRDELDSATASDYVIIACHNEAEQKRLGDVLSSGALARAGRLQLVLGNVRAGFRLLTPHLSPEGKGGPEGVVVLGDHELFHRDEVRTVLPRRRLETRAIDSFLELQEGDLVVHISHGIARYRGMELLEKNGHREEHLILEFREATRVYVPASKIDLVQKYVGGAKSDPELSKYGGTAWARKKEKVEEAVNDLASEMIELQALRAAQPGISFPPDSDWQHEFEAAFPYEETPDQLTTVGEIKRDMERARPMDRLVCGDVGYGKTELAMRAAFKAIDNGKQVAVLVPTTILAEQHYRTFSQRMAEYPFTVEMISRFRTAGEQRRIVERLAESGIDVIIGTHRLVSKDVKFKDLGLVIIDEEQRFGVEHKERLKQLRQTVDVLTLTATPIPRTLHLSLLGIRDISNLETPPRDRLAIETRIVRFDRDLIRHAILRELNREGQVYFVHNRVHNIQAIAHELQSIVPEAKITIGHGQMNEHELEQAMLKFIRRDADILVATTIIESGVDIPNVNTIFINQAENYGLADLHQLRGRVGRYKHRAYAYLVLDRERSITPNASRRLKAIEEFTELGAGFKIAMRDLEIRGAGNILGPQQSGHIAAVGYELYCQLLENSVRRLTNKPSRQPLEVNIDLPWAAYLPRYYVPGQRHRIEIYRRVSRIRRLDRLADFEQEIRDRFGPIPDSVAWLLRLVELRLLAEAWHITSVHLEGEGVKRGTKADVQQRVGDEEPHDGLFHATGTVDVVLGYRNSRKLHKLAERSAGRIRIVDEESAYFRLRPEEVGALEMYGVLKHLLRLPKGTL